MKSHTSVAVSIIATLLGGCVAPGSTIGKLAINGQLITAHNVAVPNKPLRVRIAKEYGLGGLDLYLNRPEDFGHKDHFLDATTAHDGTFELVYGPFVYHVNVWLLPPLGAFPRHPPIPYFLVLLPDAPSEIYLIGFHRGEVQYKVYDRTSRAELPAGKATWNVVGGSAEPKDLSRGVAGSDQPEERFDSNGLEVRLVIRRAT